MARERSRMGISEKMDDIIVVWCWLCSLSARYDREWDDIVWVILITPLSL